ncbi:hypothetical protein JRO89_XS09G0163500 [Xanthoceras sorbifolium]|uniref:Inositol-tetrakisphosphate 1-kinase n=1 Tax=Xanthoceras sorbifolium TaxID=99658 RepID=A0ABQ8HLJ1_9ROSI|nr:hypothetical protein JRO89_XS09G0163500 [Xanthoceras sorbifolium]
MSNQSKTGRYRIGYALSPKKTQTFILPSLVTHASQRGVDLVRIHPDKPLLEQGPYDCIVHKLYDPNWTHQLQQFAAQNPNVPIIDSPEPIARLRDRVSMLEVVSRLNVEFEDEKVGVPKQVVVSDSETLRNAMEEMELGFPVISKPLEADGSANSHQLCLVFDEEGLQSLPTPIVLQEFVNHGGVVFKVYVVGSHVRCVKRRSLPDFSEEKIKMKSLKGCLSFSQISNMNSSDYKENEDGFGGEVDLERVEMPSECFVTKLAGAMREELGLNLFNFDVIRDAEDGSRYLVIDVNYFPGYAKMPSFESLLTDFFLNLVEKKNVGLHKTE